MGNNADLKKVIIFNQEYRIKSQADEEYILEIAEIVNDKMVEVKQSGLASENQQLRIAVLACMNITDEYFSSIKETNNVINSLQNKALVIDEYVDEKLNQIKS